MKLKTKYFSFKNQLAREFLAELFGTFILLSFGLASCAQNLFSDPKSLLSSNLSFGFGAGTAVIIVGTISGCQINPAVSFAMLLTGRLTLIKYLVYVLAQLIGAFLASVVVYFVYYDSIHDSGLNNSTAAIFATYPTHNDLSQVGAFLDQMLATFLLVTIILAINDKKNNKDLSRVANSLMNSFVVTLMGTSFSFNCGGAVNPARDLGPRLFTSLAGWGWYPFTAFNYFFWIPIIGPLCGAVLATFIYSLFISIHIE